MSLEIHVYGPGFGETLFIRWPGSSQWCGGLVDAYSRDDGTWLDTKLKQLGLTEELEFAIATHPHLDHIRNLAAGLDRSAVRVKRGFYWPPFQEGSWLRFFNRLAKQEGGDLSETAEMVRQWIGYWDKQSQDHGTQLEGMEGQSNFLTRVTGKVV